MKKLITILLLLTFYTSSAQVDYKHKVKKGETLFSLSRQYNITIEALKEENLFLRNGLQVGQTLSIPSRRQIVVGLDSIQSKIIAIELNDCEYSRKELQLVEKVLQKTEVSGKIRDKLVENIDSQVSVVNKMAETNQELFNNSQKQNTELQNTVSKQNIRNGVNKFIYFILGVGTSYLILK